MTLMHGVTGEQGRYRVLLLGLENDTEENRELFCRILSARYPISVSHLRRIINQCPIVLRKDLSWKKTEALAKALLFSGALVKVEERADFPPAVLEFTTANRAQVTLESFHLWRSPNGVWNGAGRIQNVSGDALEDLRVLVQVFDGQGELLTYEEAALPLNPLGPGEMAPFKVLFEAHLSIESASLTMKNSGGKPLPAKDRRRKREWREVLIGGDQCLSTRGFSKEETEPSPLFEADEGGSHREATEGLTPEEQEWGPQGEPSSSDNGLEEGRLEHGEEASKPLQGELQAEENLQKSASAVFNGAPVDAEEIGFRAEAEEGREEKEGPLPAIAWMEEFRVSIDLYYRQRSDAFSNWFRSTREEGGIENLRHSLRIILAQARFDQVNEATQAFENTRRISELLLKQEIGLDEIPPLEPTPFASAEQWRALFQKALPKLYQVADEIIRKRSWVAHELERFIQVIPQMGPRMSRKAIRSIHELISEADLKVDFSKTPVFVDEGLYRVTCRLGIVDPQFDHYQGPNSMGDLKIQSFARAAFPEDPVKIEEPMRQCGGAESDQSHCFPTKPRCEGCLFEAFCPRFFLSLNPCERGMKLYTDVRG